MRSKVWTVVVASIVTLGALVVAPPAGAVTASFAATCTTQSGGIVVSTTHRTITYDVHAPDSVAPGTTFDVSLSFGYAVPANAQAAGAFVNTTDTSTTLINGTPGASQISGTVTTTAIGGSGSVVEVRLEKLAAFSALGGSAVGETCTPDHTLVLARVGVGIPLVSVGDAAVVEGASGTRALEFAVTLSRPATSPVTVAFDTEDGTATAGSDYVAQSGSVSFQPGLVSAGATVTVRVLGDSMVEPKENFRLRLHDPVGAALGRSIGTGRIIDDDPGAGPRLSIGDGSVVEGSRGTRSARLVVSLSEPATQTVHFHYVTLDDSARAGVDYRAQEFDSFIPAGHVSTSVPVPVLANTTAQPNRSFTVRLMSPDVAVRRANGVGTIIDDD
jgi:hypothetical protein